MGPAAWAVEVVPDEDSLHYRVPKSWVPNGELHAGVFRENKGSLSTDWSKYSTPTDTLRRTGRPDAFGVVTMNVGLVRSIPPLEVDHEPRSDNRAHTAVRGLGTSEDNRERLTELRALLFGLFNTWEIPPKA
jgi:hypothetical protein